MQFKQIMVLNDGETFTNLDGCSIVAVPVTMEIEEIEELLHNLDMFDHNPGDFSEGYVVMNFTEPDRIERGEAPSQDVSNIPVRSGLTAIIGEPRKI